MDVYGCSTSWQMNRSDEMAKQLYAQQNLNSNAFHCDGVAPDGHVMPPPTNIPWNTDGLSWGMPSPQPPLVQFTGQHLQQTKHSPVIHCKRKPGEIEPVIPAKQLITEEKMAAHLSGLHISRDYTQHSINMCEDEMEVSSDAYQGTAPSLIEKLRNAKAVVLADEIKRLKDEPLIPQAIIDRLQKPCMSLMVWHPKDSTLKEEDNEDEYNKQRNPSKVPERTSGVLVADLTGMDVEM